MAAVGGWGLTGVMTDTTLIARGLDQLASLLDDVTPDQASLPTPCSDWTIADLADHVVGTTTQFAVMAQGGQPDWGAPTKHEDQPAAALRRRTGELVTALEAGDGSFPVGMAAGELAVHTWDLATALGRDTADLDPAIAEAGHAFMSESLTDQMRGDSFGPEQQAPADADAYQRAAAFAGRAVSRPN